MKSPLADLVGSVKVHPTSLNYPDNLENLDHWIKFTAKKRDAPWRDSKKKETILANIYLPIPSKLTTGYTSTYENGGIGALGKTGAKAGNIARDLISGSKSVTSIISSFNSQSAELAKTDFDSAFGAGGALIANMVLSGEGGTGGLQDAIGKDLIKGAMFGAGVATNPHQAMLFNTVEFRKHAFSYQFAPKNAKESETVKEIIYRFKYHGAPGYAYQDCFFNYPDEFVITFHHPKFLFKIAPSVLTSFTVDYTASEMPAFFSENNAPVHINISLEFTETTIIVKSGIESGY